MAYNTLSFDYRIAENIKNYALDNIYNIEQVDRYIKHIARTMGIQVMLTDRHGEKILVEGVFTDETPDVVNNPGIKIRIQDRTIAHLYVKEDSIDPDKADVIKEVIDDTVDMLQTLGEQTYRYKESSIYIDELEQMVKKADERRHHSEKEDPLTGVMNKAYFNKRSAIIDRSEIAPVAVIEANINDWKKVNDKYGDEESDRLIQVIAGVIKSEATPEYVIGRIDGDVFAILIPIPEDGEAEAYVERIQKGCADINDSKLVPSIACGLVYKENVEETIDDKISDAEYLMFENKFEIKNSAEYQAKIAEKY